MFLTKSDNHDQGKGKVNSYLKDNESWLLFKHDGNLSIAICMSFFILHLIWFYKYSSFQHFESFFKVVFDVNNVIIYKKYHILYIVSLVPWYSMYVVYRYNCINFIMYYY